MAGAITHDKASQLRDAVDEALRAAPEITDSARAAFARLVDVLEALRAAVGPELCIISVGGVTTASEVRERLEAGATLVRDALRVYVERLG